MRGYLARYLHRPKVPTPQPQKRLPDRVPRVHEQHYTGRLLLRSAFRSTDSGTCCGGMVVCALLRRCPRILVCPYAVSHTDGGTDSGVWRSEAGGR
eukprot:3941093-Rhodomonas_salina.2